MPGGSIEGATGVDLLAEADELDVEAIQLGSAAGSAILTDSFAKNYVRNLAAHGRHLLDARSQGGPELQSVNVTQLPALVYTPGQLDRRKKSR